jgi:lysophospholipase
MIENPRGARWLARVLYWLGFDKAFVPGGGDTAIGTKPFEGNRLSSDPVRYARNAALSAAARDLAIGDPSVGWIYAAFQLMDRLAQPRAPLEVRVPTLVVAAGRDPVVSTPAIERFAARLKTGSALVLPTARHEILMETDAIRAQFWAAFDAFVPGEELPVATPAPTSAVQEGESGLVQGLVASGEDGAALGGAATVP